MTVAFDTLKAAIRLQDEAGFNEKQARVLVATFAKGIGENLATKEDMAALRSEMATKEDVAALRSEMATKEDIAVLRGEMAVLRGQMRELEQRMTIRLGAMLAAAVGIIVALDKLL